MLKDKKLDFERGLEEYLEQQKLYELFESMMKTLIVNKPADPLAHLVNKLEQPESKCLPESKPDPHHILFVFPL
jgi:adenylate kinase